MTSNGTDMEARKKRAVCIWHRRAGKDSFALNFTAVMAHQRVGSYWHMLPTLQQARRVVWDGIDKFGRRMIDQAFPKQIRKNINNTEMKIEFKNGSIWQCVGSDNYDSLVGTNPIGVIFSEYSIADPRAWDFLRPILAENEGWSAFIYTPRGKNHGHSLYNMAQTNPNWYCDLRTIEDTFQDETRSLPVMSREVYLEELASGMDPLLADQEYYVSFDAGLFGAYYTDQLKMTKVGDYPFDPRKPVYTAWDIGLRDATAIWFFQTSDGSAINVIDYWEESNVPLVQWAKRLKETPYTFETHIGPHDLEQRDKGYGVRLIDTAAEHGIYFEIAPKVSLNSGIDSVKNFLPILRFNKETTSKGWDALVSYRREYNDKLQVFMDRPVHDWASHGADALRYAALGYSNGLPTPLGWGNKLDYSYVDRVVI
jgi:hypothetical protein